MGRPSSEQAQPHHSSHSLDRDFVDDPDDPLGYVAHSPFPQDPLSHQPNNFRRSNQGRNGPGRIVPGSRRRQQHQQDEEAAENHTNRGDTNSVDSGEQNFEPEEDKASTIAGEETSAVWCLRFSLVLILLLSGLGVSTGVFFYVQDVEEDEFRARFAEDAQKVLATIGTSFATTLSAVDGFVRVVVSHADFSNSTFPFVTLPHFSVHAAQLLSLSKAFVVSLSYTVADEERPRWENYSVANNGWVDEALRVQVQDPSFRGELVVSSQPLQPDRIVDRFQGGFPDLVLAPNNTGPYLVAWQNYPLSDIAYNFDQFRLPNIDQIVRLSLDEGTVVFTEFGVLLDPDRQSGDLPEASQAVDFNKLFIGVDEEPAEPVFVTAVPIVNQISHVSFWKPNDDSERVGVVLLTSFWRDFLEGILPEGTNGIRVVVSNTCGEVFTYELNGPTATYLGPRNVHSRDYREQRQTSSLADLLLETAGVKYSGLPLSDSRNACQISVSIYPSKTADRDHEDLAVWFAVFSGLIFICTSILFIIYDFIVDRRQSLIIEEAQKTNEIVQNLFPSQVRDRLFENTKPTDPEHRHGTFFPRRKSQEYERPKSSAPVADLYPAATVLFADIAGFTAWSSIRQPEQVFQLLEAIYGAFDEIARRRGVFKVETIGDSYVAVVGLPTKRDDHAVVMTRFARDCRDQMTLLTKRLVVTLGPDTGDLQLRFGLHSGPVTAGVLRGERARFQLFGDTVNTAARMESNGIPGRIHASQATADLLFNSRKAHWLTKRDELVMAKGKGLMQTYWIEVRSNAENNSDSRTDASSSEAGNSEAKRAEDYIDEKVLRLIDYNTETCLRFLRQIAGSRATLAPVNPTAVKWPAALQGKNLVDEIIHTDVSVDYHGVLSESLASKIEISDVVTSELREYFTAVASMYPSMPFHNFEHASHVLMSLCRILGEIGKASEDNLGCKLDAFTQFASVLASLVHGAGYSFMTPSESTPPPKSFRRQKAFEMSWNLLLEDRFSGLREFLCVTDAEAQLFRSLVARFVVSTDVLEQTMRQVWDEKWKAAFESENPESSTDDRVGRTRVLLLEHLVQNAYVAHAMQHWHVYRKWNVRLFEEIGLAASENGNPRPTAEVWCKQELWFFDNMVLPLAKRLDGVGFLGGTGRQHLDYAVANREEWQQKGTEITTEFLKK